MLGLKLLHVSKRVTDHPTMVLVLIPNTINSVICDWLCLDLIVIGMGLLIRQSNLPPCLACGGVETFSGICSIKLLKITDTRINSISVECFSVQVSIEWSLYLYLQVICSISFQNPGWFQQSWIRSNQSVVIFNQVRNLTSAEIIYILWS